jgi:hypothetical protein
VEKDRDVARCLPQESGDALSRNVVEEPQGDDRTLELPERVHAPDASSPE